MTTSTLRDRLRDRLRYSLYAPVYDPVVRRLDAGRRRSLVLADLQPGERVLIPGCGTGLDFPHLPRGLDVVAGDVAPGMNRAARATADRLGLDAEIRPLDAHRLDLADDSFDVVLLHLLLAVVPDPEAAIREAARVLRTGARPPPRTRARTRGGRTTLRPGGRRRRGRWGRSRRASECGRETPRSLIGAALEPTNK
jgi:SAM-dependent methyltransferase